MAHTDRRFARASPSASGTVRCAAGRRSTAKAIAAARRRLPRSRRRRAGRALDACRELKQLLFEHACEACYGAPEYGGNRDLTGWRAIGYAGDVQPRGWSDDEVTGA